MSTSDVDLPVPGTVVPPAPAPIPPPPSGPAASPSVLGEAVKDAVVSGILTGLLLLPLVGFRATEAGSGPLILTTRFGLVAVLAGLVAVLRLTLHLTLWRPGRTAKVSAAPSPLARLAQKAGPALKPAFFSFALAYPFLSILLAGGLSESRYWVDLGIYILTYVMLGWGLNIVVGLAGLLDLGYVAFYAVGAYTFALLSTSVPVGDFVNGHLGEGFWTAWSFWICLPLSGLLAAFWGVILGFPVLRLRGDYLAIVTLAFGEIIRLVLINWVSLTNGGAGISSIPPISFFGMPFTSSETGFAATFGLDFDSMHRIIFLYFVILGLAALTALVTIRLRKMPVGRAWEALREDEIACRSLGINTTLTKLTAFATGAMFGGFAGAFFAVRVRFVSPESFTFMESAVILAIVVLGGMGSQMGVAAAAILLIGGMEMLRNLSFLKADFLFGPDFDPSLYRMLIFGFAMVAVMVWRPRGLVSSRMPTIFLKERKAVSAALVKEGHG
ncbi:high-affinity branched-chain amino acid ABC transporter permease LivM [Xanthobacter dioxanivorans]|uniref:High-affinity branched-chain amino acid ABC transporter permease LivM n=1 Tax=Xanthobacter dioxanivorans TaxID=2528964 RepID=A0A974PL92_9HYPH|nr:high-affinity branched-chain amino acid ABC transporter permease LivM [Xanthobacter dioxanivorans]QRG05685.1 high-affinity branched-chain amino acid ABC transporter permease LivM [Xanthobacter dioxanivorans]